MNHLSLFSGIGGIDLAAHWAGFETVAFCEQNKFCQKILAKHWPGVPIFDDIFELSAESLERRGIRPGEIKFISGGFPCQPYSHAGKRMGNEDDRALWPEMFRVIKEVRPDWVCGENVAGLISMALDGVLSDLESEGYTCQPIVLPACAVNAPHRRDRVFILAHAGHEQSPGRGETEGRSEGQTCGEPTPCGLPMAHTQHNGQPTSQGTGSVRGNQQDQGRQEEPGSIIQSEGSDTQPGLSGFVAYTEGRENDGRERGNLAQAASGGESINTASYPGREDVAYSEGKRIQGNRATGQQEPRLQVGQGLPRCYGSGSNADHWATQPGMGMLADGVPGRVARLKALGNSVVPQQVYPILKAIADYENNTEHTNQL